MSTLTIRIPDDTHLRLKDLAKNRRMSLNKLFEEMAIIALAGKDAETRFNARALRGNRKEGLKLLDKLDNLDDTMGIGDVHK